MKKLAELARLDLPENEQKRLLGDLQSILEYVDQIQKAPIGARRSTQMNTQINADIGENQRINQRESAMLKNVFREDKEPHEPGEYTEKLLKEVPEEKDGYVKVKKIL